MNKRFNMGTLSKKFTDSIYLKSDSTRQAATLITQIAYRFGFRAVPTSAVGKPIPGVSIDCADRWDTLGGGWNSHFKYVKKRLDRLTAKTRPSKQVLITMDDLRRDRVTLCYECKLEVDKNKTWIVCDPVEVLTDEEDPK